MPKPHSVSDLNGLLIWKCVHRIQGEPLHYSIRCSKAAFVMLHSRIEAFPIALPKERLHRPKCRLLNAKVHEISMQLRQTYRLL